MAIGSYIPLNISGGITYQAPSFNWADSSQTIGGGLTFDMPLATAAMFNNSALSFAATNTENSRNFFSGIVSQAQSNVSSATDQSYKYQNQMLATMERMNQAQLDVKKYEVKKKYSIGNLLKPGSNCFITTAVCHTLGLGDTCAELQALRRFRDDYLESTEEGIELVLHYYEIAPRIVEALDAKPNAAFHYNYMLYNFIHPALQHISCERFEEAKDVYVAMVGYAKISAGIED